MRLLSGGFRGDRLAVVEIVGWGNNNGFALESTVRFDRGFEFASGADWDTTGEPSCMIQSELPPPDLAAVFLGMTTIGCCGWITGRAIIVRLFLRSSRGAPREIRPENLDFDPEPALLAVRLG